MLYGPTQEVEYPAPWTCRALAMPRALLEVLRDTRTGGEVMQAAVDTFANAEHDHRVRTGCTDRH